jgi:hypothetical protein
VGSGIGAAVGKEGYRDLVSLLSPSGTDTRSPGQIGGDVAMTFALNALMPWLGAKIGGPMIRAFLSPGAATPTLQAARDLETAGVAPPGFAANLPGGVAAESRGAQATEQTIAGLPGGSPVRDVYAGTTGDLQTTAGNLAQRAAAGGTVPNAETFGSNVNAIGNAIDQTFQTTRQQLDDTATRLIGADRPVDLKPLTDLHTQLQTALGQAPGSLAARYQPALDRINTILADATKTGSNTLPYSVVRNLRTDLGQDINPWNPQIGQIPQTGIPALQQLYGALKDSLTGAADDAGPLARTALDQHDSYVTRYMADDGPASTMRTLADPGTGANRLTRMMQSSTPQDADSLAHLWSYANPGQQGEVRAGIIQQAGTMPDGTWSPQTFLTNYGKMNQSAKDMVFGYQGSPGSLQSDLDNFATVQQQMARSASQENRSRSGIALAIVSALNGIAGHLVAGEPGAAAAAGATAFGGPWVAGKVMTSQPFTKWLTSTWGIQPGNAAAWGEHLARLATVAQLDPSIAPIVGQLHDTLAANPPAGALPTGGQ